MDEEIYGVTGNSEPVWDTSPTQDGGVEWTQMRLDMRPKYYHRDGTPIVSNELMPDFMQWALMFEQGKDRIVGKTKTLYGELLSTVYLGLDHRFGFDLGPPLIFETMLFAPARDSDKNKLRSLRSELTEDEREQIERDEAYTAKHYPHDQFMLRHSTERQAQDAHEQLKLHCLVPPRWRHFLLGTIGGHAMWKHYEEEEG
jgi:hypothetical protein